MMIKKGIPVSHGIAMCPAVVLDAADQPIPRRVVPRGLVAEQHARLARAIDAARQDIENDKLRAETTVGINVARIFDWHLGILQDQTLLEQIGRVIDSEHVTADYAVFEVLRDHARNMRQLDNPYFRERERDIWDVERRLIDHLLGDVKTDLDHLKHDVVLIARDLTPSQTASLDKSRIKGIALDLGGATSHTSILAHALGIPAVVGCGNLTAQAVNGNTVIVDGNQGQVIVSPSADQQFDYRQRMMRISEFEHALDQLVQLPAETTDGTTITLMANIEFPEEIPSARAKGAQGIGLYRTEYLYLAAAADPSEEEQYQAYKQAVEALGGLPMTIRTLDLGADKLSHTGITPRDERNPFLGARSIRICLQNPQLFKTQLRAILRASAHGPLRIMFPLISNIMELRQAKMLVNDVKDDLEDEGVPFDAGVLVGIMVEVPSVAIEAAKFAREVDFFSIGTNDLIQYTVAVDRGNERIANLYSAANPAVLKLIKDVVRAGARHKVEVGICGEMAGELEYMMLLIGLGLRTVSMTPPAIPEVKKLVRSVSLTQCKRVARKALSLDTDREVLNYLRDEVRKVLPEAFDGRSIAG